MMPMMFRGIGMFSGMIWIIVIPLAIFLVVRIVRSMTTRREKRSWQDESNSPEKASLESKIMAVALDNGGTLTVSDVVLATGLTVKEAEETLNHMVDGFRVKMEVKDSGIIAYEFAELLGEKEGFKSG